MTDLPRITDYKLDVAPNEVHITFNGERHRVTGYGHELVTLDNGSYEADKAVVKEVENAFKEALTLQFKQNGY